METGFYRIGESGDLVWVASTWSVWGLVFLALALGVALGRILSDNDRLRGLYHQVNYHAWAVAVMRAEREGQPLPPPPPSLYGPVFDGYRKGRIDHERQEGHRSRDVPPPGRDVLRG